MVYSGFRSLSPAGLLIDDVEIRPERILIVARSGAAVGRRPDCGRPSERVHSRYERRLLDLPSQGRAVQMRVAVRRFRCSDPGCRRRIFAEPLGEAVAGRSARRTSRLEAIVYHLGIALGGRPAAALARRLMLPVSKDTLLRAVRRHAVATALPCTSSASTTGPGSAGSDTAASSGSRTTPVVDLLPDPTATSSLAVVHPEVHVSRATAAADGQAASERHRRRCKLPIAGT